MACTGASGHRDMLEPPLPTHPAFDELTHVVGSGKCVAFVGAGLSRPQYPDWRGLIADICSQCSLDIQTLPDDVRRDHAKLVEHARENDRGSYNRILKETFADKPLQDRQLCLARVRFASFITTNYDSLIRRALEYVRTAQVVYYPYPHLPVRKMVGKESPSVFHVHGCVECHAASQEIVLSESDYEQAYSSSLLESFLVQVFAYSPVCFLGYRLADDERIRRVFRFCSLVRGVLEHNSPNPPPRWYILLDQHEASQIDVDWEDHGMTCVTFDKVDDAYSGLDAILGFWAGVRKPRKSVPYDELRGLYLPQKELPR